MTVCTILAIYAGVISGTVLLLVLLLIGALKG